MLYVKTNRITAPIVAHITFNTISYCITITII
jgi:membrane protease YdiL (CAAX protease family)